MTLKKPGKPQAAVGQLGMVLASLGGATLTLPACGRSPPPVPTAAVSAQPVPAHLELVLPAEWTRCTSDDDCAYVTDGCCATAAVNRSSLREGKALPEDGAQVAAPELASARTHSLNHEPGRVEPRG